MALCPYVKNTGGGFTLARSYCYSEIHIDGRGAFVLKAYADKFCKKDNHESCRFNPDTNQSAGGACICGHVNHPQSKFCNECSRAL